MILEPSTKRVTLFDRLDPRVRVMMAVVLSLLPVFLSTYSALVAMLCLAIILCVIELVPVPQLLKRLAAVNVFVLMLLVILPWSVPGESIATFSLEIDLIASRPVENITLVYSEEGFFQALVIALKCNAVMLTITALLSTMQPVVLGHALEKLRLPGKLVHVLMFTLRYLTVLEEEYRQLRQAMTMRGFKPRLSGHTLRAFGNLVGMMLVRAWDRSDRIMESMQCRGFSGRFYSLRHYALGAADAAAVMLTLVAAFWLFGMNMT